ncbi:MAG: type VI secretion system baseplate subunit TssK [Planctomycetota bacterium]|nr:MAG: type VI secretion system baseplate subunit TssK [Planctomycetota bacterium]
MDHYQKVMWSEGLLMGPQHLQQADRYHEQQLRRQQLGLGPFSWGLSSLTIDRQLLTNGTLHITAISCVLPDGSLVCAPDLDEVPPARDIRDAVGSKATGIYLALAVDRPGAVNVSAAGQADGRTTRYLRKQVEFHDECGDGMQRQVSVASKQLRLLVDGESRDGCVCIRIAEVLRRPGGDVELIADYAPPALTLEAAPALVEALRGILDVVVRRAGDLTRQRRQRAQGVIEFATNDTALFWLLSTLNGAIPQLAHYARFPTSHPQEAYLAIARLVGQVLSFGSDGTAEDIPAYDHHAPGPVFAALRDHLTSLLETILPSRCVQIPLDRLSDTTFAGDLPEELGERTRYYLAVSSASGIEKVSSEIPLKAKISSRARLPALISQALRGVALSYCAVPPGEIPAQPGYGYFELTRSSDEWQQVLRGRDLGIYIPPEFVQLDLALLAIKEAS